ncbi:MAG: glycoside hydrolase family 16 protein [Bacteroidales bacterium]|nr:glycoside hydrolase family 16 protein [Bacteroidales bacterium]
MTGYTGEPSPRTAELSGEWKLVWSDEFDEAGLPDPDKWDFDTKGNATGWGNNEAQYYTYKDTSTAMVKDGLLHITARKKDMEGKHYISARLFTKQSWLYGRFEIRAKLPSGRGSWPALWMLPTEQAYGRWPGSGEIDIMENVGYDPAVVHGTVHTKKLNHVLKTQKGGSINVPDAGSAFHTYTLEWEATQCRFYVDDVRYFSFDRENDDHGLWPFDKHFRLLVNVAVGGNWGGAHGIDDDSFPLRFEIDYVRVYQKKQD